MSIPALLYPLVARADAPRDMATGMRVWLDGLDVNGTDTGNGGGTNPVVGAQVTAWQDKSGRGLVAGDATSWGAVTHTYPKYAATGVNFDGVSNILEIPAGLYSTGEAVAASEVFGVYLRRTSAKDSGYLFLNGPPGFSALRQSFSYWYAGIYYDHFGPATTGRAGTTYSASNFAYNTMYVENYNSSTMAGTVNFFRNGASKAAGTTPEVYTQAAGHRFYIGGAESDNKSFLNGTISEFIAFSRTLNTAERNIMQSYLAAKHANPGGVGTANRYTVTDGFRYHVGGIGQEADGSLTTGTSAGLTISNGTFLGNGKYLLAGVASLNPATGAVTVDAPTGFTHRSQRTWYVTRTGTGAGNVTMTFNPVQMGLALKAGDNVALGFRSTNTGNFTALSNVVYSGTGTISFTANNPQSGFYALAVPAPTVAPALNLTLASQTVSDGVRASNFKLLPGAVLHVLATTTNSGDGSADTDSTVVSLPIAAGTKLFVGDLGAAGSGPVQFTQGVTASGLTYAYTSLGSTTDRLDFSNNSGATWTYVPVPDAQQADAAVTNLRVRLGGAFANNASPNFPSFTLKYALVVK